MNIGRDIRRGRDRASGELEKENLVRFLVWIEREGGREIEIEIERERGRDR